MLLVTILLKIVPIELNLVTSFRDDLCIDVAGGIVVFIIFS